MDKIACCFVCYYRTDKTKKQKRKTTTRKQKKENKRTCFFGYGIILYIVYFKSVNHSMLQININSFMFFRLNLTMLLLYSVTISAWESVKVVYILNTVELFKFVGVNFRRFWGLVFFLAYSWACNYFGFQFQWKR